MKKDWCPTSLVTQLAQPPRWWARLAETSEWGGGQRKVVTPSTSSQLVQEAAPAPGTMPGNTGMRTNRSADPNPASSITSVEYLTHSCSNSKVKMFSKKTKTGEKGRQDIMKKTGFTISRPNYTQKHLTITWFTCSLSLSLLIHLHSWSSMNFLGQTLLNLCHWHLNKVSITWGLIR